MILEDSVFGIRRDCLQRVTSLSRHSFLVAFLADAPSETTATAVATILKSFAQVDDDLVKATILAKWRLSQVENSHGLNA